MSRRASFSRRTSETEVIINLVLDSAGRSKINTGIGMLDHLLAQLARHARFDLELEAKGDLQVDEHHTVEDVAIGLGRAFREALGEGRGIFRMGHALVPMDEALAFAAVDLSGRGYAKIEAYFGQEKLGKLPTNLIGHFLESLAIEGRFNLHACVLYGVDDHHKAEALFKALGRALDTASRIDERISGEIPSTKETLS